MPGDLLAKLRASRELLAVWDARAEWWPHCGEAIGWAAAHIADHHTTFRVEFYLIDSPFAVVHRYARNENGLIYIDPATRDAALAVPAIQLLDELPPAYMLRP